MLRLVASLVQLDFEGLDSVPPQVGEITLNLRTGEATLIRMQPEVFGDFPKIRNELTGAPSSSSSASYQIVCSSKFASQQTCSSCGPAGACFLPTGVAACS